MSDDPTKSRPFDVPLDSAILYWMNDGSKAIVIPHPEDINQPIDTMMSSTGACSPGYDKLAHPLQMLKLLTEAWSAVVEGASPGEIHRALCQIPEFRRQFADDIRKPVTTAAHMQAAHRDS